MKRAMIILASMLFGCVLRSGDMCFIDVDYFPIGYETYTPITTSDISEAAIGSGRLKCREALRLLRIVREAKPGKFDSKRVRLKASLSNGDVLFLDNDGGLIFRGEERALDRKALEEVKELIESEIEISW